MVTSIVLSDVESHFMESGAGKGKKYRLSVGIHLAGFKGPIYHLCFCLSQTLGLYRLPFANVAPRIHVTRGISNTEFEILAEMDKHI